MDNFTLFAGNAIILLVMALAFLGAYRRHREEVHWKSWCAANIVLATALFAYMIEPGLPYLLAVTVPNCLLVAGFGLRWRAARQFAGRPAAAGLVWGPAALFLGLCSLPWLFGSYPYVYTSVNIVLAGQATAIAYEFWRDRQDRLPSRYGLVAAYAAVALSFAVRVVQGLFFAEGMGSHLPDDLLLQIHLVVAVFHTVASGAFALSIAYERSAAELRKAALHDSLTGLPNRRAFESRLREHVGRIGKQDFALVLLDVDHFKLINDRYGHAAGDAALRRCARICARSLRPCDFVARIGGEEFAVILPDTSAPRAYEITDRLRRAVRRSRFSHDGQPFTLTLSAGICHSATGAHDFDEFIRQADLRLYQAKHGGRDRVEQFAA